jgi:hypothetical protein
MFIMSGNRCRYCSSATSGRFLPRVGSIPTVCNPIFFHPILQFIVVLCFFPSILKTLKVITYFRKLIKHELLPKT